MKEAIERFTGYLGRRYGDRSTPKHYISDLHMFVRQVGAEAPKSVTATDVDAFISAQIEQGLKPATINRRLASLHTFFEFLASEEPDQQWPNPVNWRRHRVKEGQLLPRDASEAEVAHLFAAMDDVRDRALFGLMVGAGLRVGEVADLTCTALEPPAAPDQPARLRVCGKGRKERIVWITPRWYSAVQSWLDIRPSASTDHLFLNQHRRPLTVNGIQYRLRQHCQRANLHVTCHQLRHTFARRLTEQRMPTESIGQLLGHAQIASTQRYTNGADPDLRDAFLAAMDTHQEQPLTSDNKLPPPPPSPRPVAADREALKQAAARFALLPDWVEQLLVAFLHHRWRNWQPHRAADNAHAISHRLVQIWQWLVTECHLTGWADLQRSDVEAWLDEREASGLAVNTRRSQLSLLLASLRFACDQNLPISANLFRVPYPARPEPLPRYLSEQDYQRLLHTVHMRTTADTPRNRLDLAWFLTLAHTGIRTCELLNLRIGDVDFSTQRLFVRGAKTAHDRVVYLTPTLSAVLSHYLLQRPHSPDDHLWMDGDQPLSGGRVRYCVQRWGQACQVNVSPHRLRHTLATQLINQGMPLASVSRLLGHRSLNTTQHYARLYEQTVKEQFISASHYIEGVAVSHWPQPLSDTLSADTFHEQLVDSM